MNELARLQERVIELEGQLGIKSTTFHMYEGSTLPTGMKKIIGHMPPIVRIEFGGKSIELWGGAMCLTIELDNKPFKDSFSFEVAP